MEIKRLELLPQINRGGPVFLVQFAAFLISFDTIALRFITLLTRTAVELCAATQRAHAEPCTFKYVYRVNNARFTNKMASYDVSIAPSATTGVSLTTAISVIGFSKVDLITAVVPLAKL